MLMSEIKQGLAGLIQGWIRWNVLRVGVCNLSKTVAPRCFFRCFIGPSGLMLRTYRDASLGAMAQR
jgi:hypothetical protein